MTSESQKANYSLIIVESPTKAKTIAKYLGKSYKVISCNGHVRDLPQKKLGIDIEAGFQPSYCISSGKKELLLEIKKHATKAKKVFLASDDDREGEAIAWHLREYLGIEGKNENRMVFREITKNAIQEALTQLRKIDMDLVDSQQARRILDRIVGFELSPLLWRKIKPSLSAGRVQSVAVKLIVEREREHIAFVPKSSFNVEAFFDIGNGNLLRSKLQNSLSSYSEAQKLLELCKMDKFKLLKITKRQGKENPSLPFITSSLQQEANRRFGYSVLRTMVLAQNLYEEGHITYMRTDSPSLSENISEKIKVYILGKFGANYSEPRKYKTKSKGAQEAHEAIRPTNLNKEVVSKQKEIQQLYKLIWQRTIASQMASARIAHTSMVIESQPSGYTFNSKGEEVDFDGFLRITNQVEGRSRPLPKRKVEEELTLKEIIAKEQFSKPTKARYSEASLVRELESRGIGRPSTYAPTITTVQKRGYVLRESRSGDETISRKLILKNKKITATDEVVYIGRGKNKLFPTDVAILVNDFLTSHFSNIINYDFTAEMEDKLDKIAHGKLGRLNMLSSFYSKLTPKIDEVNNSSNSMELVHKLGIDPHTGKPVMTRFSRKYGALVQLGEIIEGGEKPRFAGLLPSQLLETMTLDIALKLLSLPRIVGKLEEREVSAHIGKYGPYLKHKGEFYGLYNSDSDPYTIEIEEASNVITREREKKEKALLKSFAEDPEIEVRKGRYGNYLKTSKGVVKIDNEISVESLTLDRCKELIEEYRKKKKNPKKRKKAKKRK